MKKTIHRQRFWFFIMGLYESMELLPPLEVKGDGPLYMDINIEAVYSWSISYSKEIMQMYLEDE